MSVTAKVESIKLNCGETVRFDNNDYQKFLEIGAKEDGRKFNPKNLDFNYTGLEPITEYITDEIIPFWIAKEMKYNGFELFEAYGEIMTAGGFYFPITLDIVDSEGDHKYEEIDPDDLLDLASFDNHASYYSFMEMIFGFQDEDQQD